jgi:hypothetical protein
MTLYRGRNKPTVRLPLKWAHAYFVGDVPTAVFPIDVSEGIADFGMMGNDTYGNCGPCGEVHEEMTTAVAAKTAGPAPDSSLAVDRYVAYTGTSTPSGPGVDLASYLLWCFQKGYILAFAPVDQTNKASMQGFMQAGFGLYIGVNLSDQNEDQFNAGQPWTAAGGPDPNDGHCVLWVGSASASGPHGVVTWGKVQPAEDDWINECLVANSDGEAFLVVTTEEQLASFDPALLADIKALGGTEAPPAPLTPPAPPPAPAPAPAPPAPPQPPLPPAPSPPPGTVSWLRAMLEWIEEWL